MLAEHELGVVDDAVHQLKLARERQLQVVRGSMAQALPCRHVSCGVKPVDDVADAVHREPKSLGNAGLLPVVPVVEPDSAPAQVVVDRAGHRGAPEKRKKKSYSFLLDPP